MPLNFPTTGLTANETTYTFSGNTWIWNGYAWDSVVTPISVGITGYVFSVNGLTGVVTGIAVTGSNTFTGLQTMNAGITANNLYVSGGATFTGDVSISGNLTVSGGITSTFSETVLIEDNFILLNSNLTAGGPTADAGIEISRGASANVQLRWNETTDRWQFTNDGTQFYDLPTSVVSSWNGSTGVVTFSDYVVSVNGSTGAITNVAKTDTAQTFTAIQSFSIGITAAGATFNNNLYAGTIKGGQLNVQNTNSNIIGDYTNTLGGGYIQIDNSSGQAFNRIAGTLYTDAVRIGSGAVPALNVTGSIYTSGLINTTARVSCAGITSSGVSTFTGSLTSNNLYVSQGATFNSNAVFVSGLSADDIWVTNGATFAANSSFNSGLSSSNLWVTNGATFNSAVTFNANPIIQGAFSALTIRDTMGATMSLNPSGVSLPIIQVYKDTGSQTLQFNPSATNPVVTLPSTTTTLAGLGVTQSFTTAQTFTAVATFNSGLTANTLMVASGATFFGNADFRSGLSADDIWITNGATFSSRSSFNAGLSASNLWVTNGATFASNIFAPNIVTSVNGTTGAVITYVGTTGNIPYRYGSGVGITANSYFTVAANLAGSQTDILKFSGPTSMANPAFFGDLEAKGLLIDRFYNSLGLDEGGGVEIRALGQLDDGGGGVYGSNLILTTPTPTTTSGGSVILAPTNVQVLIAEPTAVSVFGALHANSGVDITANSQMIRNGLGAVSTLDYQATTTTATTANQNIASWTAVSDTTVDPPIVNIRSMEITIQAENSTTLEYERVKFLVIHDNTNTYLTEISDIRTGRSLATYSTTLTTSGTTKILYLRATPANASSTIFRVTTSQISSGIS